MLPPAAKTAKRCAGDCADWGLVLVLLLSILSLFATVAYYCSSMHVHDATTVWILLLLLMLAVYCCWLSVVSNDAWQLMAENPRVVRASGLVGGSQLCT